MSRKPSLSWVTLVTGCIVASLRHAVDTCRPVALTFLLLLANASVLLATGQEEAPLPLVRDSAPQHAASVAAQRAATSPRSLLIGIMEAVAATLVLILLLILLRRLFSRSIALIRSWQGTVIRSLHIQSIEILHEERIVAALSAMLRFFRLLLVVGLLYLYIPLVLSFFPWTAGLAARLFEYIETPLVKFASATLAYVPNLFFVAIIALLAYYALRFCRFLFNEIEQKHVVLPGFYPDWALPSYKIIRFLILVFAIIVAFPYLPGSDSPAFKGISVFLGVLFSLGSTSAIANMVAGVILTYMRAFILGDRVKIADTVGDVVEKTLLVTRIRTIKNEDITIPNAMVLGSHIVNYSSSAHARGLILHTTVTIGYDAPWRQVHELLIAAARSTERILHEPSPFVFQTALNDFYVSYEINAYTDAPGAMAEIYSQLHQNIQDQFNAAGVEIMSPHYKALRDGNHVTIPPDWLPPGYAAPSHRVTQV